MRAGWRATYHSALLRCIDIDYHNLDAAMSSFLDLVLSKMLADTPDRDRYRALCRTCTKQHANAY